MKRVFLVIGLAALLAGLAPSVKPANAAPSCDRLWYNKTAIYARSGKCFTDPRALKVFGQRCFRPYGKLTFRNQRRVDQITRQERRAGCPA